MIDLVVVGGGIVGLACAMSYLRRSPGRSVLLLEKEARLAAHQSGHNSGVLHSGVYYTPGSRKARNCRLGKRLMEEFCREHGIPFETRGKLIVATRSTELPRLEALQGRAKQNGVEVRELDAGGIQRLEPAVGGVAALHVPETAIVDFGLVAQHIAHDLRERGGEILTGQQVHSLEDEQDAIRVTSLEGSTWSARQVLVCGGLQSDRLARASGLPSPIRIVPFLGEYRRLKAEHSSRVQRLIYPVPDPRFPFLGVHLTPRMDGRIDCGPNALPTLAREGYSKRAINLRDAWSSLSWPGTWRLALKQLPMASAELHQSLSSKAFAKALRPLLPGVEESWFEAGPTGVRAQALDRQGHLVDDFAIESRGRIVHLINAPSPAATSCLAIADSLVDKLETAR